VDSVSFWWGDQYEMIMREMNSAVLVVMVMCGVCTSVHASMTSPAPAVGQWDLNLPELPADPRHHPITFTLNDLGYVLMGVPGSPSMYAYNATLGAWTTPRLSSGYPPWREYAYGVSVGGKAFGNEQVAFLGLGRAGSTILRDWYQFDGEIFTVRASMPVGHYHPAMVAVETEERGWSVYVGAGGGSSGNLKDWYEYSVDDDTWTRRADLPGPERHHPYYWDARVGDKHYAYVGFGHGYGTVANPRGIFNDVYRYDPDEQSWEQMADFPGEARVAGTQFTLHSDPVTGNDRPFVLSGDGDDHSSMETGELWEYMPVSDSWLWHPPHPGNSRWAPGAFVIGCDVYFTCGYDRRLGWLRKDLMKDRLC